MNKINDENDDDFALIDNMFAYIQSCNHETHKPSSNHSTFSNSTQSSVKTKWKRKLLKKFSKSHNLLDKRNKYLTKKLKITKIKYQKSKQMGINFVYDYQICLTILKKIL
jgi:hypothetical protein